VCSLWACADNVSDQVKLVKQDLSTAIELIALKVATEVAVNAKSSSVTASVVFAGTDALAVKNSFGQIASKLNYDRQPIEFNSRTVICHHAGTARFLWLEIVHNQPLQVVMGATITGWPSDAKMCSTSNMS
jgi:hypothetical protein